jgi:hypothetical protein
MTDNYSSAIIDRVHALENALRVALLHADYFSEQLEMARCLEPDEESRCDQLCKARETLTA